MKFSFLLLCPGFIQLDMSGNFLNLPHEKQKGWISRRHFSLCLIQPVISVE